jgi:hypothetical protein
MKFYDHRHINGLDLRRLLAPKPIRPSRRLDPVYETLAFLAVLAAIIALFGVMQ